MASVSAVFQIHGVQNRLSLIHARRETFSPISTRSFPTRPLWSLTLLRANDRPVGDRSPSTNASSICCSLGFPDSSRSLRINMTEIQYTLLSDGSADKVLMPILAWLLHEHLPHCAVQARWPDLGRLRRPPKGLHEKIQAAADLSPCNVIFVHRDAETASLQDRQSEVDEAVSLACKTAVIPPAIAVVPVRMMEAWLLFDEQAVRDAAGNRNGTVDLGLPRLADAEDSPDPKSLLHRAILEATGKGDSSSKAL